MHGSKRRMLSINKIDQLNYEEHDIHIYTCNILTINLTCSKYYRYINFFVLVIEKFVLIFYKKPIC